MADYKENMYHPPRQPWEDRYVNHSGKDYNTCRRCGAQISSFIPVYRELHDQFHDKVEGIM